MGKGYDGKVPGRERKGGVGIYHDDNYERRGVFGI